MTLGESRCDSFVELMDIELYRQVCYCCIFIVTFSFLVLLFFYMYYCYYIIFFVFSYTEKKYVLCCLTCMTILKIKL